LPSATDGCLVFSGKALSLRNFTATGKVFSLTLFRMNSAASA